MRKINKKLIKKKNNILIIAFQFIIASSILLLGKNILFDSETIIITMELAKKKAPIVLELKEENNIVYDNMTIDQLADKLNKSLNGILAGKGSTFAQYSIEYKIDPYLSLAIVLHETGCKWNCSYLATACNNIGGQKGYPTCGNSSYKRFSTLEEGIKGFYNNLYYNYYSYGLTDVYSIHSKYAEDPNWPTYINNYINEIKNK